MYDKSMNKYSGLTLVNQTQSNIRINFFLCVMLRQYFGPRLAVVELLLVGRLILIPNQNPAMSKVNSVKLSDSEIDAVLNTGGVGVISFADDDEPYSVPVSYGYDSEERNIYIRFGFASESEKRRFVDDIAIVSLVVTKETGGWHSVVARGPISKVLEPAISAGAVESILKMNIPYVMIHKERATDLDFELYRLDPETLTGRKER